jgi:hypothetical protein
MGSGTINTFTFEERDGKTKLTVTTLYKTRAQRDAVLVSGMESGVGESYERLDEVLRSMA